MDCEETATIYLFRQIFKELNERYAGCMITPGLTTIMTAHCEAILNRYRNPPPSTFMPPLVTKVAKELRFKADIVDNNVSLTPDNDRTQALARHWRPPYG